MNKILFFARNCMPVIVLVGFFAAVVLPHLASAATFLDYSGVTLRMGSRGQAVVNLQSTLNMPECGGFLLIPDGVFGPRTNASVVAFQQSRALVADALVGPITKNALVACANMPIAPSIPTTPLPDHDGLDGGPGSIEVTAIHANTADQVSEDDREQVLAFRVEAQDSDIKITSIALNFANIESGSENLNDYLGEVSVIMDDEDIGSEDVSDFDRDSGNPDIYSQTISLDDAVIEEGDRMTFYIEVEANDNIDSGDIDDAQWVIGLESIRFQDGNGSMHVESDYDETDDENDSSFDETFTFTDESDNDDEDDNDNNADNDEVRISAASSNPSASTLEIDQDDESDEFLVGAFTIEVGSDVSDVTINELPIMIDINDDDNDADGADSVINDLRVRIDGDWYDADLDSDDLHNGDGTATYIVDLDGDDVMVESDDEIEVRIYATFESQEDNFGDGTTIRVSVEGSDIDAEDEDDDIDIEGSFTGKLHTLELD